MRTEELNQLATKLFAAVTTYDRKQAGKRGHNPYALGIYFERCSDVVEDIRAGKPVREAVMAGFCDRLLSFVLKAIGEADFAAEEAAKSGLTYTPQRKS